MSWAAHRKVSRAEDEAYCLLGLFNVNLPLLYGEGSAKAFRRLQEAIYEADGDCSLFLFRSSLNPGYAPLFSEGATRFCQTVQCADCSTLSQCFPPDISYSRLGFLLGAFSTREDDHFVRFTRQGSMVRLPVVTNDDIGGVSSLNGHSDLDGVSLVVILNISHNSPETSVIGLPLERWLAPDDSYVRPARYPVVVPRMIRAKLRGQTYPVTVREDIFRRQSMEELVLFQFKSESFDVTSWSLEGDLGKMETTSERTAQFLVDGIDRLMCEAKEEHYSIIIRVSNTRSPGMQVLCCLGSEGALYPHSLSIERVEITSGLEGRDSWTPGPLPPQCDRLSLSVEAHPNIHIALRRQAA